MIINRRIFRSMVADIIREWRKVGYVPLSVKCSPLPRYLAQRMAAIEMRIL